MSKGIRWCPLRTREIQKEIWSKLWGNMNMNPISALTGSTGDKIMKDPLTNQLVRRMMIEHLWIGQKIGIELGMTIDERFAITRKLGAFKTSMLQDLESKRPLEIDALLASVIEIGALGGVPTPYCDTVLGLIRQRAANLGLYRYARRPRSAKALSRAVSTGWKERLRRAASSKVSLAVYSLGPAKSEAMTRRARTGHWDHSRCSRCQAMPASRRLN